VPPGLSRWTWEAPRDLGDRNSLTCRPRVKLVFIKRTSVAEQRCANRTAAVKRLETDHVSALHSSSIMIHLKRDLRRFSVDKQASCRVIAGTELLTDKAMYNA